MSLLFNTLSRFCHHPVSIPGSGRSPGEGNGNPLQYSCLENPMDRGAWWATVHGVAKSRTRLSDYTYLLTYFLPRSKHLLISWLKSPSAVISEPKKRKYVATSTFSPSICHAVSSAFLMMCSAYRLNKQGDSRQLCHTPFSILNQSVVPYKVLTVASWLAYISQETGKMIWYSYLFKSFPQFTMIHTVKGFGVVDETEVDAFLEFSSFVCDPANVGSLISSSSFFSKPNLDIWNSLVHIILKPSM